MLITGTEAFRRAPRQSRRMRSGSRSRSVPRKDIGGVTDPLATSKLKILAAEHHRMASQLDDPRLERQAGPGGRLLKDQRDRAARRGRRSCAAWPSARSRGRSGDLSWSAESSAPGQKMRGARRRRFSSRSVQEYESYACRPRQAFTEGRPTRVTTRTRPCSRRCWPRAVVQVVGVREDQRVDSGSASRQVRRSRAGSRRRARDPAAISTG